MNFKEQNKLRIKYIYEDFFERGMFCDFLLFTENTLLILLNTF